MVGCTFTSTEELSTSTRSTPTGYLSFMSLEPKAFTMDDVIFLLLTGLWLTNSRRSAGEERVCSSRARWASTLIPSASACPRSMLDATLCPKATESEPSIASSAPWTTASSPSEKRRNDMAGRHRRKSMSASLQWAISTAADLSCLSLAGVFAKSPSTTTSVPSGHPTADASVTTPSATVTSKPSVRPCSLERIVSLETDAMDDRASPLKP